MQQIRAGLPGSKSWLWLALSVLAIWSSLFLARDVDLRVYWYGVTGFFGGTRPAYGPGSGLGFPMEFRYPPVTYLLLSPLSLASLRVAGFFWMLAAWVSGTAALMVTVHVRHLRFSRFAIVAALAFLASYLVLAVRYGNVQPFVIAWLLAALTLAESRPFVAGTLFALAVTFKIWPVLFLPWFLRRSRWRTAASFATALLALWVLPVFAFGLAGYGRLLYEWFEAVKRVGATYSEFYYFPGQSLRSLLLRLCTALKPPLPYFPDVHILSLAPQTAVTLWMILACAAYLFFVLYMLRSGERNLQAWDGLAFVMYSMLEPYAVKSGLISLAPAALIGAALFTRGSAGVSAISRTLVSANRLFLAACALSLIDTTIQYKPWQRWLLSIGLDFWAELLLLAAYVCWIRSPEVLIENADSTDRSVGLYRPASGSQACERRP